MRTATAAIIAATALSGCAQNAASVQPAYVPGSAYAGADCSQLRAEAALLAPRIEAAMREQDSQATADAITLTVGMVLFWPALLAMPMGNDSGELAALKGQAQALDHAAAMKGCVL